VDTGTNVNLIEPRLAGTIGMNATFRVDLASASGKTLISGTDGSEIELGSVIANSQRFLFSRLEAIHNVLPDVQGVLGHFPDSITCSTSAASASSSGNRT